MSSVLTINWDAGISWLPQSGSFSIVLLAIASLVMDKDPDLGKELEARANWETYANFSDLSLQQFNLIYVGLKTLYKQLDEPDVSHWILAGGIGKVRALMATDPRATSDKSLCKIQINSNGIWEGERWIYEYIILWVTAWIAEEYPHIYASIKTSWLDSNTTDWSNLSDDLFEATFHAIHYFYGKYRTPRVTDAKSDQFLDTMSALILKIYPVLMQDLRANMVFTKLNLPKYGDEQ